LKTKTNDDDDDDDDDDADIIDHRSVFLEKI
jgi:hypothetical protein